MSLCTRKLSSLTITLTALLCSPLIAAASATASYNPQPGTPKPIFIVWVHTALSDQGAPVLNAPTMRSQPERTFILTNAGVEHIRHFLGLSRFHFALLLFLGGLSIGVTVFCFLSCVFQSRSVSAEIRDAQVAADRASARKVQEMDRVLKEAIALSLKTDSFSEAACRTAAVANGEKALAAHAAIEQKEAERITTARARAARYEVFAAYAAPKSELGHAAIVDILRNADEWEFRVLQEAKRQAAEEPAR